jgi:5'-nucleotidase
VDFRVMSALGYDAMEIGNHDFDAGVDGLAQAARFADFELLSANYDFSRTVLAGRVKPYIVRKLGDIRVGIFGLGVGLDGLVSDKLRLGVGYADPFPVAQRMVDELRVRERCPLLVCLSHLGNEGYQGGPGDHELARAVEGIDLIVGGHSHTFMETPSRVRHGDRETIIHQVGFGGLYLGRVDFHIAQGQVSNARATALPVDGSLAEAGIDLPAAS